MITRDAFSQMLRLLARFDGMCPRDCQACEDPEAMVLLPGEEEFLGCAAVDLAKLLRTEDGFLCIPESHKGDCPWLEPGECSIYACRPVDCRIFPLYPVFDVESGAFTLKRAESHCPGARNLPEGFENAVREVCHLVNQQAQPEWKKLYNRISEGKDLAPMERVAPVLIQP